MLIDSHIHIADKKLLTDDISSFLIQKGIWENIAQKVSPEGLAAALDQAGVNKAVIFPLGFMTNDGQWQKLNDLTARYIDLYPDRFIGYGIINPNDIKSSLKELERCVDDLNFAGVKVHPTMQVFYPNDEKFTPVYSFCEERRIPILFHTGASLSTFADKYSHPLLLDEVAVRHPKLLMIIAHAGRPYYQDAALLLRKHENVYADVCANQGRVGDPLLLEWIFTWLKVYADGVRKLIFGSDFPVFEPKKMRDLITALHQKSFLPHSEIPLISEEELDLIFYKNIQDIFGKKLPKKEGK